MNDMLDGQRYNTRIMCRRVLTYLVIIGIATFGYQPAATAMLAMNADAPMTTTASAGDHSAMPDCAGMNDQSKEEKLPCEKDGSCATRCHLNSALEAVALEPVIHAYAPGTILLLFPAGTKQTSVGPLFRPPIL